MKKITVILAMLLIGGLEFYALSQGINGVALSLSIGALSGLGGWHIKGIKTKASDNG